MGAFDRAAAARAQMAQAQREMAERRALRDRNFRQRREQAVDAFKKQGPVMEQVAKHMGELGRRRAQAGGWATEKTERDKDFVMEGFGFEDEEPQKNPYEFRAARPAGTDTPPGGIGVIDEDESPLQAPPQPEAPPAPEPAAPAPPARAPRRPAPRQELDDEDDFSNQSSWMQNR
jgi:hypothetical protein